MGLWSALQKLKQPLEFRNHNSLDLRCLPSLLNGFSADTECVFEVDETQIFQLSDCAVH